MYLLVSIAHSKLIAFLDYSWRARSLFQVTNYHWFINLLIQIVLQRHYRIMCLMHPKVLLIFEYLLNWRSVSKKSQTTKEKIL